MFKLLSIIVLICAIEAVYCGVYGRGISNSGGLKSNGPSAVTTLNNSGRPVGAPGSNPRIFNGVSDTSAGTIQSNQRVNDGVGLSAFGLISILVVVIAFIYASYYGIICYPLICNRDRNYDIMNTATNSTTPTQAASELGKSSEFNSRPITPSST